MRRQALAVVLSALASPALLAAGSDDAFRALVDREWQWRLREDPIFATSVGVHDYDDRLPSVSLDDQARRDRETRAFIAELAAIDRDGLTAGARVDYEIFRAQLEGSRKEGTAG